MIWLAGVDIRSEGTAILTGNHFLREPRAVRTCKSETAITESDDMTQSTKEKKKKKKKKKPNQPHTPVTSW